MQQANTTTTTQTPARKLERVRERVRVVTRAVQVTEGRLLDFDTADDFDFELEASVCSEQAQALEDYFLKELVMSEDIKKNVDTKSAEFKQGVEAGLNSEEDTKNWKAGNELGQELKDEGETTEPVSENPVNESSIPLFIRDTPEGNKGDAQDEKDETGE